MLTACWTLASVPNPSKPRCRCWACPGAGAIRRRGDSRPRQDRQWPQPRRFYHDGNKPPLTYHPDRRRCRRDDNHAYLQSVGRGQEFVLDLAHYPEVISWLYDLMDNLGSNTRSG